MPQMRCRDNVGGAERRHRRSGHDPRMCLCAPHQWRPSGISKPPPPPMDRLVLLYEEDGRPRAATPTNRRTLEDPHREAATTGARIPKRPAAPRNAPHNSRSAMTTCEKRLPLPMPHGLLAPIPETRRSPPVSDRRARSRGRTSKRDGGCGQQAGVKQRAGGFPSPS